MEINIIAEDFNLPEVELNSESFDIGIIKKIYKDMIYQIKLEELLAEHFQRNFLKY